MSITDSAREFVDASDSGRGWEACAQYCHAGASFSVEADALAEISTVELGLTPHHGRNPP